jgi:hypothetical protein
LRSQPKIFERLGETKKHNKMKNFILYLLPVFLLLSYGNVSAQSNVALKKQVSQSSLDHQGSAARAVDGNTNGAWTAYSVTHTRNENGAWLQVDLGAAYDITSIKLYNRTDCCQERLAGFSILVSETEFTGNTGGSAFASNVASMAGPSQTFTGKGRGRYVRVFLNGTGILSLAEVEVFGTKSQSNQAAASAPQGVFGELQWVRFEGKLPQNAVIGGLETNRALAVCRAVYQGGTHPGKVVGETCNIGYGGAEKSIQDFEVLVNSGSVELDWIKTDGEMPENAIEAGGENGLSIYIGRSFHENGTHPGKVFKAGGNYICNIGWGGKEITHNTFEILVENPPHASSKPLAHNERCSGDDGVTVGYISTMAKDRQINEGSSLVSSNFKYQTRVTDDGRLVVEEILDHGLCNDGRLLVFEAEELWSHTPDGGDANLDYFLKFQEDGNLCIYSEQNGFVWCSMSNDREGDHFEITNIGHIEIVNSHGGEVWPD